MLYLTEPSELGAALGNEPGYRAEQVREWLYRHPVLATTEMTNLPAGLRAKLAGELWPFEPELLQSADGGTTLKWLFRAPDGAAIETVVMGYAKHVTICVSSQAGCALACTFCATGQFGFERHLDAGEIVAQVAYAQAHLRAHGLGGGPTRIDHVVFMGMGEPLANYPRVRDAIARIVDDMGISARKITVSTVGVVPGMERLAKEPWPLRLAVSLHAADDELRSQLVPLNRRYPLAALEEAAAAYAAAKHRRISIEWTMIDGVNDSTEQAARLAVIARRLRAHVNLIALNPTPQSADKASGRINEFASVLAARGVAVTIRDTRGVDIDAACGQLRIRATRPEQVSGG